MNQHRAVLRTLYVLALAILPKAFPVEAQATNADWKPRLAEQLQARLGQIVPRKVKTRGKPRLARWEDVDAALADLEIRIGLSAILHDAAPELNLRDRSVLVQVQDEIDRVIKSHSVTYSRIFLLDDPTTLFPLTNNVLRLSADDSFTGLEVFDNTGFLLGKFASKYVFEKTGGLSSGGGGYRLTYFQYTDNEGSIRPSANINLLDTYSVRWGAIREQPALTLTVDSQRK